jgi:hypothetical protein
MYIPRSLKKQIIEKIMHTTKGIVLYGARQTGKTTLVTDIIAELKLRALTINGDQHRYIDTLTSRDSQKIQGLVHGYDLLFVDEAQRIPEIGINLKIILDTLPKLKVIVTGSSSLDLASRISEPLTGRVWVYRLYPIATHELTTLYNPVELDAMTEERLIYGSYPDLFSIVGDRQKCEYLENVSDAYLYRDLLEFGGIRNSGKIRDLLKLLAFQVGSQVSLSELGATLGLGKDSVARYIDLLEKSYVIFRLGGFRRNLRKEVAKMDKIYFYDTGIRNILIDNMNPIKDRNDAGQLWENFLIVERMKFLAYTGQHASMYFWRTYTGAELDYVEQAGGRLSGFEIKWAKKSAKKPQSWQSTYTTASYTLINRETYLQFITKRGNTV